jgi:hypothetical protein
MKRLMLMAAVLVVAACGRPGDDDDYEETVYDRQNPPAAQPSTGTGAAGSTDAARTGTQSGIQRDSLDSRRDSLMMRDSLRRDSLRRDSLRRGTIRDTTPR